jgi:hypothetical protein
LAFCLSHGVQLNVQPAKVDSIPQHGHLEDQWKMEGLAIAIASTTSPLAMLDWMRHIPSTGRRSH